MITSQADLIASLQSILDGLSASPGNPPQQKSRKFWAGFTINKVKYRNRNRTKSKNFSELIGVLERNAPGSSTANSDEFFDETGTATGVLDVRCRDVTDIGLARQSE